MIAISLAIVTLYECDVLTAANNNGYDVSEYHTIMVMELLTICLLYTSEHYDHIGGIDDLRPYCKFGDIDIYANAATVSAVRRCFPYCFAEHLYCLLYTSRCV